MAATRNTPTLPVELSDAIIDHLADDWRTLAACALIPSERTDRARSNLCKQHIVVFLPDDLREFVEMFSSHSPLTDLPISLSLTCGAAAGTLSAVPRDVALGHLRNLRALTLARLTVSGVAGLRSLYTGLPRLDELYVDRIILTDLGQGSRPAEGTEAQSIPPIKMLRIHMYRLFVDFRKVHSVVDTVRRDMLQVVCPVALSTLSLHIPWRCPLSEWAGVLTHSRKTLRTLRIIAQQPLSADKDAPFYAALAQCAGLTALTVSIIADRIVDHPPTAFVASLAAWLAPLPTYAFARTLRELSVPLLRNQLGRLPVIDVSGGVPAGGLKQVLRRDAFPALMDLRVTMYGFDVKTPARAHGNPQAAEARLLVDDIIEEISAALRPLTHAGVRVNVGKARKIIFDFLQETC